MCDKNGDTENNLRNMPDSKLKELIIEESLSSFKQND